MTDDKVSFRWRDYAHGHRTRTMTLDAHEFPAVSCCIFCLLASYASATSAYSPLAIVILRSIYAESTCGQDYPSSLAPPVLPLAWLSSVNTAVAALCDWLRFSLLRDSPSGCSHLNRRIPHDSNFLSLVLPKLLGLFHARQRCVPVVEFFARHELNRF